MSLAVPSPLQKIELDIFEAHNISVHIKRDDLIHEAISGNKWRKLKFNIEKYKQGQYSALLTFGGAYSNHIAATAYLGKILDIPTIGIIRGEELNSNSNHTLFQAEKNGMALSFVSREQYKERYEKLYWEELRIKFGHIYIVEEGGANFLGMLGCAEILTEIPFNPDYMMTASGTGTTAAGLLFNTHTTEIISVPVFKNGNFIKAEIKERLEYSGLLKEEVEDKLNYLQLETRFHFGGYGKHNSDLLEFMNWFYQQTSIPLDQVYTGKMVYAFFQRLKEGYFKKNSQVLLLHTGGLQGVESVRDKLRY